MLSVDNGIKNKAVTEDFYCSPTISDVKDESGKAGNLEIWDQVKKTDLTQTKTSNVNGRDVTTITTNYMLQKATEMFGPIGWGWGYKIEKDVIELARETKCGKEMIHTIQIMFWYKWKGELGQFQSFGHTYFAQSVKKDSYISTNEDYAKKSLSDAIKKALSMLGFCDDVYSGRLADKNVFMEEAWTQGQEKILEARNELDEYLATIPVSVEKMTKPKAAAAMFDAIQIKYYRLANAAKLTQEEAKKYSDRLQNLRTKTIQRLNEESKK